MFDDVFTEVKHPYMKSEAIIEREQETYADRGVEITSKSISSNHGLGEVIAALLNQDLQIKSLREYDYSPYSCFNGTVEFEPGKIRIEKLGNKIPMVYSVVGFF